MAAKSENDSESAFQTYLMATFPPDAKRTRSAVIRSSLAQKIVNYLKGTEEYDKIFRHFVKKSRLQLLDLPSVGIRDALVVKLKQEKQVRGVCVHCIPARCHVRGMDMWVSSVAFSDWQLMMVTSNVTFHY